MAERDRGSVTAEMATALPVLILLLAVALAAVAALTAQMRCVDAAREGARAAARGEPPARVSALAGQLAPAGARVQITPAGPDLVAVTVSARAPLLGDLLSPIPVQARSVALLEPGVSLP